VLKKAERKSKSELKDELMEVLRQRFRPEFLNRIDEVIIFEALDREQIEQIVNLQLEKVKRIARGQGIEITFESSIIKHLANVGYLPEYGARELSRQIKSGIENSLAKEILKGEISEGSVVTISHDPGKGVQLNTVRLKNAKKK
jgi:ATP-dependent Clp protease ATP-binding subunit ClpC